MDAKAYRQFLELERTHWWMRGRRTVYLGLLAHELKLDDGAKLERALDLGAGMGGFLPGLAALAREVHYTDVDDESLAACRQRGFALGAKASGYALPFEEASFDLVCLFDAIEHIEDDQRAMREVARVLKPGGRVFVSVPAYPFLYANNDRIAQHYRRYTRSSLEQVFRAAELEVQRNTHTNVLLFPLILPAVLAIKTGERLLARRADPQHTNLSWPLPSFAHDLLHAAFAAELRGTRHFDWPAGHSIAALARKPA